MKIIIDLNEKYLGSKPSVLVGWKCDTCHIAWYQHVLWSAPVIELEPEVCGAQMFENGQQVGRCEGTCVPEIIEDNKEIRHGN